MSTTEKIIHEIAGLRPEKQSEVPEFVEFGVDSEFSAALRIRV